MRINAFGLLLISLCFRADLFLSLSLSDKKRKELNKTQAWMHVFSERSTKEPFSDKLS